jgi:hypothetical protein
MPKICGSLSGLPHDPPDPRHGPADDKDETNCGYDPSKYALWPRWRRKESASHAQRRSG